MDLLWHKTELEFYLTLDEWSSKMAIDIIAGFDPEGRSVPDPDIAPYPLSEIPSLFVWQEIKGSFDWDNPDESVVELFNEHWKFKERLERIWDYSTHSWDEFETKEVGYPPPMRPPKFYIDYFVSKRLKPAWLDWAMSEGYFSNDIVVEKKDTDYDFNIDSPNFSKEKFPHELNLAIMAYKYAVQKIEEDNSQRTPQTLIEEFLEENTQEKDKKSQDYCSKSGKDRIKVVANWAKEGGLKKL